MLLEIEHYLRFQYSAFVRESHMEIRVEPRTLPRQVLHDFDLAIGPHAQPSRHEDWMGNALNWFSITDYHDRVEVVVRSLVETSPVEIEADSLSDTLPIEVGTLETWDFLQFSGPVMDSPRIASVIEDLGLAQCTTLGAVVAAIRDGLGGHLQYQASVTDAHSTSDDALEAGAGVCQDFAHVTLAILRSLGIPCRYVNGYLHVEHPDRPSQSHAWIDVWSPAHGWVGFDPTHGCSPDERHVVVAVGRTYDDVPPNRGIFRGTATETMVVEVRTTQVERTQRHQQPAPLVIDVPVFSEAPDIDVEGRDRADEAAQQQQQQQ